MAVLALAAYGLLAALRDDAPAVPDVAGLGADGKNRTASLSAQGMTETWWEGEYLHIAGLMTVKYRWSSVAISVSPRRPAMAAPAMPSNDRRKVTSACGPTRDCGRDT